VRATTNRQNAKQMKPQCPGLEINAASGLLPSHKALARKGKEDNYK
jgi:hypothetical protein